MLTPADLAGLCALTETSRPEEQEYVLWVIRNRVESPRFPDTYEEVILQPKQFSAFNYLTGPFGKTRRAATPAEAFASLTRAKTADTGAAPLLAAVHLAEKVLAAELFDSAFLDATQKGGWNVSSRAASAVMHYYSPLSMKPPGSAPPWAKSAKRLFTPPGIDPQRFVFAEGVP